MLTQYKVNVAPLYRTQLEQHLFATASPRRRSPSNASSEKAWREWLRARWAKRAQSWKAADSKSDSERS